MRLIPKSITAVDRTPIRKNFNPPSFPRGSDLRKAAIRKPGAETSSSEMNSIRQVPGRRHQQAAEERGQQQEVVLTLVEAALAEVPERHREHDDRDRQEEQLEQDREVVDHEGPAEGRPRQVAEERERGDQGRHHAQQADRHREPLVARREEDVDHQDDHDRPRQDQLGQDRVVVDGVHRAILTTPITLRTATSVPTPLLPTPRRPGGGTDRGRGCRPAAEPRRATPRSRCR